MIRLLIVDDEVPVLHALQRLLRAQWGRSMVVDLALNGREGLRKAMERRYDLVMSDLRMPGMDGLEFLSRFSRIQPEAVRLLLTGVGDFATAQRAVNEIGVFRYLSKPWTEIELHQHLQAALRFAAERHEQRDAALAWSASQGQLSAQELERRRLEAEEPGITQVEWAEDGAVLMPALDDEVFSLVGKNRG